MTRARFFLVAATCFFVGWLVWLGYAVYVARYTSHPPVVVSRAQLAAATHLLVAEVAVDGQGLPAPKVKVVEVVRGEGPAPGAEVVVTNLGSAMPPGSTGFPGPGVYLVPAVGDGETFRVAGLPRSPGYEGADPVRPAVYPWSDDTRAQLRSLGLLR